MSKKTFGLLRTALSVLGVGLLVAACGGEGPAIAQARIGAPTGPNAALYFMVRGYGDDDALIAVSTEVADSAELHETVTGSDGTVSMQPVSRMELPGDDVLILEPGGLHVMLIGVDDLAVGDKFDVTLTWENAGNQTIEVQVADPADVEGDG